LLPQANVTQIPDAIQDLIGQVTSDFVRPVSRVGGKFRIYATTSYVDMIEGIEMDLDFNSDVKAIETRLTSVLVNKMSISESNEVHIFLPSGLPFVCGTLGGFFGIPWFSDGLRILYAIVTRRLGEDLLEAKIDEVCDFHA
jgi:hypothetical protein